MSDYTPTPEEFRTLIVENLPGASDDWAGSLAMVDRALAAVEAKARAEVIAKVRSVFEMQCPPVREHFGDSKRGRGAYIAHVWWDKVLGGLLRDLEHFGIGDDRGE